MKIALVCLVDKNGVKSLTDFPKYGEALAFVKEARSSGDYIAGCAMHTSGVAWRFGAYSAPVEPVLAVAENEDDFSDLLEDVELSVEETAAQIEASKIAKRGRPSKV